VAGDYLLKSYCGDMISIPDIMVDGKPVSTTAIAQLISCHRNSLPGGLLGLSWTGLPPAGSRQPPGARLSVKS